MNSDFASIDKSDFKCLQHEDGSIYYGQLVQVLPASEPRPEKLDGFAPAESDSSSLVVSDISQVPEELHEKLVMQRHGYGIQIQPDKVSRYAGMWHYDTKHGDGHLVSADGSEYRGNLNNGQFDGYGQFIWPKVAQDAKSSQVGHAYTGSWSLGKMHGSGEFQHNDGHLLSPNFCNGLFNLEGKLFVNPFNSEAENRAILERIQKCRDAEAQEEKDRSSKCNLHRVSDLTSYHRALHNIRDNGRTPFVVSSIENPLSVSEMCQSQDHQTEMQTHQYLRSLGQIFDKGGYEQVNQVRAQLRAQYFESLATKEPWLLQVILDEDQEGEPQWVRNYDPDVDLLFGKAGLPSEVWCGKAIFANTVDCPEQLKEHLDAHYVDEYARLQDEARIAQIAEAENRSRHTSEGNSISFNEVAVDKEPIIRQHLQTLKEEMLHEMTFFSKHKFPETLEDDALMTEFKKRFSMTLKLNHIDLVFVSSLQELPSAMGMSAADGQTVDDQSIKNTTLSDMKQ